MALKKLVQTVMLMYKRVKTRVRVGDELSKEYVGIGHHQKSVFSTYFFAIVLDVLSKNERKSSLYEMYI